MKKLSNNSIYQQALQFIESHDLNELPVGKTVIEGDNLWVNIIYAELKSVTEAKFELHNEYIDIQIPLSCDEQYGVKPRNACTLPIGEFNKDNDNLFFEDKIDEIKTVKEGDMIVFETDTAHAPLIGNGPIHKVVIKVKK